MKKAKKSLSVATVIVSAIALSLAANDKPMTGADLARALSAVARTSGETEISRQLIESGLGKNSSDPLTEARAVALLKIAGLAVSTSHPNRILTRERADALIRDFGSALQAQASQARTAAGKKGGLPETMDDCVAEANHGQCVKCCKEMGGRASSCAKTCMAINKPSPSEPLP